MKNYKKKTCSQARKGVLSKIEVTNLSLQRDTRQSKKANLPSVSDSFIKLMFSSTLIIEIN